MIGTLPKALNVDGIDYPINTDFRAIFDIMSIYEAKDLSMLNKTMAMMEILYRFNIPPNVTEAYKKAMWFINAGITDDGKMHPKTMDYEKDEQLLFSAIMQVAGRDIRADEHCHWWTFLGYCNAISPDSMIANIVNIRRKMSTHQKLEVWEKKFYATNKDRIDIKREPSDIEKLLIEMALGGGGDGG